MDGRFETYIRPRRRLARLAHPRRPDAGHRRLALRRVPRQQTRHRGQLPQALELAPAFADRVRAATARGALRRHRGPNFFRRPYGPGWALVGDAGYNKDFITAQGITTPSATPSCAPPPSTRRSPAPRLRRAPWAPTRPPATPRPSRCTSSPPSSRPWSPHRPSSSSCSAPSTATRRRWTASPGHRRGDLAGRVLLRGERPADHLAGRSSGTSLSEPVTAWPSTRENDMSVATNKEPRTQFLLGEADRGEDTGGAVHPDPPLISQELHPWIRRASMSSKRCSVPHSRTRSNSRGSWWEKATRSLSPPLRGRSHGTPGWVTPPVAGTSLSRARRSCASPTARSPQLWGFLDQMALLQQIGELPTAVQPG